MKYAALAILAAMVLTFPAGCGRKGPIIPPGTVIPGQVHDLRAEMTDGAVVLAWSKPENNTNDTTLTDLAGFDILRAALPKEGEECDCKYEVVANVYLEMPGDAVVIGKRVAWPDKSGALTFGSRYGYMVRAFNTGGYRGPDSNPVTMLFLTPPQAPGGLTAVPGDGTVDLTWEPVQYGGTLAGYNVYRTEKTDEETGRPLNKEPVADTHYKDTGLTNGKELYYRVSALAGSARPYSEGPMSAEVTAVPVDKIPPAVPEGLQAVPSEGGVLISWIPDTDADLAGYILYRKGPGDEDLKALPGMPTMFITYTDKDVEAGKSYTYAVSAVDNAKPANESALSGTVTVNMPVSENNP